MTALLFVTGNPGKAREAQAILNCRVLVRDIDIPEIQSLDVLEIVRRKAEDAFAAIKRPLLVDDVSVAIRAWNGLPGPFVKYFASTLGVEGIARLLRNEQDRSVVVRIALGFHDGRRIHTFTHTKKGTFALAPAGRHGFGWDSLFIPDGQDKTYGEMLPSEKNVISHRRAVLEQLKRFLGKDAPCL